MKCKSFEIMGARHGAGRVGHNVPKAVVAGRWGGEGSSPLRWARWDNLVRPLGRLGRDCYCVWHFPGPAHDAFNLGSDLDATRMVMTSLPTHHPSQAPMPPLVSAPTSSRRARRLNSSRDGGHEVCVPRGILLAISSAADPLALGGKTARDS